jgi:hypothetical protein
MYVQGRQGGEVGRENRTVKQKETEEEASAAMRKLCSRKLVESKASGDQTIGS